MPDREGLIGATRRIPLSSIKLSARPYNCLTKKGIEYVDQLSSLTRSELSRIDGLGDKSISEIQYSISKIGLSLCKEAIRSEVKIQRIISLRDKLDSIKRSIDNLYDEVEWIIVHYKD